MKLKSPGVYSRAPLPDGPSCQPHVLADSMCDYTGAASFLIWTMKGCLVLDRGVRIKCCLVEELEEYEGPSGLWAPM